MAKQAKNHPRPIDTPPGADASSRAADGPKVNKSEEIRIEARRILDAGGTPRPKTIVDLLGARGIEVVSPQVSQVLKRLGVARRTPTKRAPGGPSPAPFAPRSPRDDAFTLPELIAAKQFVEAVGSVSRATRLLDALERLG